MVDSHAPKAHYRLGLNIKGKWEMLTETTASPPTRL